MKCQSSIFHTVLSPCGTRQLFHDQIITCEVRKMVTQFYPIRHQCFEKNYLSFKVCVTGCQTSIKIYFLTHYAMFVTKLGVTWTENTLMCASVIYENQGIQAETMNHLDS